MVVCHPLLQADGEGSYPHLLRRLLRHTEIGDPELIRPIRLELAMDPILRTRRGRIAEGGSHNLAAHRPPQAEATHQAFNGAARHLNPFSLQLPPDFIGAIHLEIGPPNTLDMRHQEFVTPSSGTSQGWI